MNDVTFSTIDEAFKSTITDLVEDEFGVASSKRLVDLWSARFRRRLAQRVLLLPPDPPETVENRTKLVESFKEQLRDFERQVKGGVPFDIAYVNLVDALAARHQSTLF